jgi:hypothetical protein
MRLPDALPAGFAPPIPPLENVNQFRLKDGDEVPMPLNLVPLPQVRKDVPDTGRTRMAADSWATPRLADFAETRTLRQ